MQLASWVDRDDRPVSLAVLVPRRAGRAPPRGRHHGVTVDVELAHDLLFGRDGRDALSLHLVNAFEHVVRAPLDGLGE